MSTGSSNSTFSSLLSALPIDAVSDRIRRLSQSLSPFSEVQDIERLFDISEQDEDAEEAEQIADQDPASPPSGKQSSGRAASQPDSPAESESPIARHKSRFPDSASTSDQQPGSGSRSSVKRSAESSPDDDDDDDDEDPVKETQKKKPLLRFRKLKVARQLFEQTQMEEPQLEHMFHKLDIGTTPVVQEEDVDDEEPISIRSGSGCSDSIRSFFLTRSSVEAESAEKTPEAAVIVTSSPKSWNSHSCEQSHCQSMSVQLTQTQ